MLDKLYHTALDIEGVIVMLVLEAGKKSISAIYPESETGHLKFIIKHYFSHFRDKNISLSICDINKAICFITEMELKLYNLNFNEVYGKRVTEISNFFKYPSAIKKIACP